MPSKTVPDTDGVSSFARAPFTAKQVDALNSYQRDSRFPPFTCDGFPHEGATILFATRKGWICAHCDYAQDWAYGWMAKEITA